jgi:hypothetical protein
VYPNPAEGILALEGVRNQKDVRLQDMNGAELPLLWKGDRVLDVSFLKSGIYTIENAGMVLKFCKI